MYHLEILKYFVLSVVFFFLFLTFIYFSCSFILPFKFIMLCDSIYLFYCPLFIIISLQVIYHFKYITRKSLPSALHSFVWIYISIWYLFFLSDIFLLPFSFLGSWIYGDILLLYSWSTDLNKFLSLKMSLFYLVFWKILSLAIVIWVDTLVFVFFFSNLKMLFHCLLIASILTRILLLSLSLFLCN